VVAALAFIVVVGTDQSVDTPPDPDSLPAAAPSGSSSPSDRGVSVPAPWDVRIPQIRTPGPVVPTPHVGFRDLPDLSATLDAGPAHAEIRGGTSSSHGTPPQVNDAVIATTLGFLAVSTTVLGVSRGWLRWRQGATRNAIDRNPETTGTDGDDLLMESEDAGEPLRNAPSDVDPVEPLGEKGELAEPLVENSVLHGSTCESPATARDTAAPEEAARAPQGEAEDPPPSEATDGTTPSREEASSRVVLFTATKWGG
jgi:hypothetical protein